MIWAGCIFSQSATGEVSSAYFRKLAISRGGECKFSQMGPTATRAYLCRNTLTVQTCGPQALVKSPQSERSQAEGLFIVQKPAYVALSDFMLPHTRKGATGLYT